MSVLHWSVKLSELWSGRPGSNRRHPAWEAGVLPLNYSRSLEQAESPFLNNTLGAESFPMRSIKVIQIIILRELICKECASLPLLHWVARPLASRGEVVVRLLVTFR
jgi:hypothetical protein